MAIIIKGNNNGIVVENGNVSIDELSFEFGKGIKSAKGVRVCNDIQDVPYEEVDKTDEPIADGELDDSIVGDELENSQELEEEDLNYDSPRISMQQLLKRDWFAEMRTDERYDAEWTDAFVTALMESDYKDGIAIDWAVRGKREKKLQIKAFLLGLLADNGVLEANYSKIAQKVGLMDNPRSFSRYMSQAERQPYSLWVSEYVENHGWS